MLKYEPAETFDAVLLDAPCSSTGTVRRHPDIPWTKSPEDVAKLAELAGPPADGRLAYGEGRRPLVFSNCSLDPAEGELLVAEFLAEIPTSCSIQYVRARSQAPTPSSRREG